MKSFCFSILFFLLSMTMFSCNEMRNSTRTEFPWEPCGAAPKNYPVETKYVWVKFGKEGYEQDVMESNMHNGIGYPSAGRGVLESDPGLGMPTHVRAIWLSFTEQKFYEIDTQIPDTVQKHILQLFRQGFMTSDHGSSTFYHTTYSSFVVNFLPHGNVWLSLFGIGNSSIVVCDSLKGKEINMSLKEFNEDAYNAFGSLDNYCKVALKDYEGVSENLKEHGVPDEGLWNSYKERFRYDFEFNFEDKQTKLGSFLFYKYTNGELGKLTDGYNFTMRSRPKKIAFDWNVGDVNYDAEFYFNEDEILDVFKTAFSGNRNKKGIMVINISKYNNRFDIYLSVNGKKYALKKTQIVVFKKMRGDEARLFYDNSPKEDIRMFIGD